MTAAVFASTAPSPLPSPQEMLAWAEFYAFTMRWVIMPIHRWTGSYASNGRPVCSCELTGQPWKNCISGKPGKHPWKGWNQAPMETPEQGYAAWREVFDRYGVHNGVNIGVRTGPQSGLFAVDLDVGGTKNGIASLEAWMQKSQLSWSDLATLSATTGGGGCHLLYKYPKNADVVSNATSIDTIGNAVDIRGEGGFILVAPSVHHSARCYHWRTKATPEALLEAHPTLLSAVKKHKKTYALLDVTAYTPSLEELKDYADELSRKKSQRSRDIGRNLLAALAGEPVGEIGTRHDVYRDIGFIIRKKWPRCNAAELLPHLYDSLRAWYTDEASFDAAVANVSASFGPLTDDGPEAWAARVALGKDGKPVACDDNMLLFFENHPAWAGTFGYNTRTNRPVYLKKPPLSFVNGHTVELNLTRDKSWISAWLRDKTQMSGRITSNDVQSAIIAVSHTRSFDPLQELILQLRGTWDGVPRLDTVFQRIAGTPDNPWARLVTPLWFKSLIARILYPGCQCDTMLILEGEQSMKKSSFFRTLLPDPAFFSDTLNRIHLDVESIRLLHSGPAIFEIGELSGLRKQEVEEIKAFISAPHDDLRPLYENYRKTPRRCVFVGTTNRDDYLRDETGGRRFWPLKVLRPIDLSLLLNERAQWFAEALHRVENGERWWIEGGLEQNLAAVEQDARFEEDIWFQPIATYLSLENRAKDALPPTSGSQQMAEMLNKKRAGDFVTSKQVAENVLNIELKNARSAEGARINRIIRKLGWISDREYVENVQVRGWKRPRDISLMS